MSYKKHQWSVIAHDFNSPFTRNYIWTESFFRQKKMLNIPRVVVGTVSRRNGLEYIADIGTWTAAYEKLKSRIILNSDYIGELIDKAEGWGMAMNKWAEKNILNVNLTKLSDIKLHSLICQALDRQGKQYAYGTALVFLDFQGFSFVEGNLEKYLKECVSAGQYQEYFRVFTQPPHNSFAQDQEEALLKLIQKFYSQSDFIKDLQDKPLAGIKKLYPRFYKELQKHTKKFAWVYYVYAGPAYTEQDFLNFIKDFLAKGILPKVELENIKKRKQEFKKLKQEYLKKLKPDKFNKAILNLAGKVVWAKPRRKDWQSQLYYYIEKLQREIGRRLYLSLDQVRSAPFDLLEAALLKHKKIDTGLLWEIYEHHICVPNDDGTMVVLYGKEAGKFSKQIIRSDEQVEITGVDKLQGTCACPGKARGIVKIINQPIDIPKMNRGDILISVATTPSVVPAMKRAAAIVTDEGGLTCHASIVSRELGIPCVVGTKIATKVFKDGDLVEVDAEHGIVKKV